MSRTAQNTAHFWKHGLGEQFDFCKFHDIVLTSSSMSLDMLEEMVLQYIWEPVGFDV